MMPASTSSSAQTPAWWASSALCLLGSSLVSYLLLSPALPSAEVLRHWLLDPLALTATGRTLALILAATAIAVSLGFSLAWLAQSLPSGPRVILSLLGRALAASPISALAWLGIILVATRAGLPIESLQPYLAPSDSHDWPAQLARQTWAFLLPALLLALPLLGHWLGLSLTALQTAAAHLSQHSQSSGQPPTLSTRRRLAWLLLRPALGPLALSALAWSLVIEHTLGLPGSGQALCLALRADQQTRANLAAIACTHLSVIAALLCALASWLAQRRVAALPKAAPNLPDSRHHLRAVPHLGWIMLFGIAMLISSILAVALAFPGAVPQLAPLAKLARAAAFSLPESWLTRLLDLAPALSSDLAHSLFAAAIAFMVLMLARPCLSLGLRLLRRQPRELPQPWFIWVIALAVIDRAYSQLDLLLGLAAGLSQLAPSLIHSQQQRQRLCRLAAISLGAHPFTAWARHSLPGILRHHIAWLLQLTGTLTLWRIVIISLTGILPAQVPTASLGLSLLSPGLEGIQDPALVIGLPMVITAIAVLSLWQASRIIAPSDTAPSSTLS